MRQRSQTNTVLYDDTFVMTRSQSDTESLNILDTKNKNEPRQPVQILQDAPSKKWVEVSTTCKITTGT